MTATNHSGARRRVIAATIAVSAAAALAGCGTVIETGQNIAVGLAGDEGEATATVTTIVSHVGQESGAPAPTPAEVGASEPARATPAAPVRDGSGASGGAGKSGANGFVTGVSTSGGTVRASSPSCDSRGILIMESVVVQPGVSTERAIANALAAYPGGEFTTPGACPSLRAQVDGADVYPVYLDYGRDTGLLCNAAARTGGNARVLSDRNEYVSPC